MFCIVQTKKILFKTRIVNCTSKLGFKDKLLQFPENNFVALSKNNNSTPIIHLFLFYVHYSYIYYQCQNYINLPNDQIAYVLPSSNEFYQNTECRDVEQIIEPDILERIDCMEAQQKTIVKIS